MGLAPALAVAALVAMPAAAQATLHWEVSQESSPVAKVQTISWGRIAFTGSAASSPIECENTAVGWVERGGAQAETTGWSASECRDTECETGGGKLGLVVENEVEPGPNPVELKWKGELTEAKPGTVRLTSTGIQHYVHCQFGQAESTEKPYALEPKLSERNSTEFNAPGSDTCFAGAKGGTSSPKVVNSQNPNPSQIKYTGGAGGELRCTNNGIGVMTGPLKISGFAEQEEISTHS